MHTALYNGCQDIARFLIDAGAPLDVRNDRNLTPWDMAKEDNLKKVLDAITQKGQAQLETNRDVEATKPSFRK